MKEAIEIIGQELRWHTAHKGASDKGEVYEDGFIAGIVHLHALLLDAHAPNQPIKADHGGWELKKECELPEDMIHLNSNL